LSSTPSIFLLPHYFLTFCSTLKRRSVRNPTPTAVGTAQLLLRLIAAHKFTSLQNLVDYVLTLEDKLSTARPREMSIRNMVRRVLGIIREEAENAGYGDHFKAAMEAYQTREEPPKPASRPPLLTSHTSFANPTQSSVTSLFNILSQSASPQAASAANSPPQSGLHTPIAAAQQPLSAQKDIRPAIIQDIKELVEELESSETSIAEYAPQVIHKNEVIMTYGLPATVHRLLLRAAHKREHDFTVVVVEGSPNIFKRTHGAAMNKIPLTDKDDTANEAETAAARKSLQERGVQVIAISDSDIFNFVGRVNKVFLAANYVLADGSVLATAGALNVVRAAKALMKPVVVVAGSHVLCPVTSYHQEVLIEMGQPVAVGYDEGSLLDKADFPNPLVDLIEAQFVTMFVTNKYAPLHP
jgi:translation initiation factor eIF-2B subunit beta